MKRVLFITAYTPSEIAAAEKNTKIMLQDLGKQFMVDLVYFKYKRDLPYSSDTKNINVLKVINNSVWKKISGIISLPYLHPVFSVRYRHSLLRYLQAIINKKKYIAIVFDHSQMMIYARKLKFDGPKIMLSHDVEAQRFERVSNKVMSWFCKKSENYVFNSQNAQISTFSQKDVDLIKNYYGKDAHLCLDYIDKRIVDYTPEVYSDQFVMFGNWKRADNFRGAVWLLNNLGKFLKTKITIAIIGYGFPMEKLNIDNDKIEINNLGFLENPYEIIASSKAMLVPLLTGAGIKVKVIESLASGTPVIGTDLAFEGFSDKYKTFMKECQSPEEFAEAITALNVVPEKRLAFKHMFIDDYNSDSIPVLINKLNNIQNNKI